MSIIDSTPQGKENRNSDSNGGGATASKQHILLDTVKIMSNPLLTPQYTPDRFWRELGFASHAPRFPQVLINWSHDNYFQFTDGGAQKWPSRQLNSYATQFSINQINEKQFFRNSSDNEQQLRLSYQAVQQSDRPAQIWRYAVPFSANQYASLFMQFRLDIAVSTYNVLPFFLTCFWFEDYDQLAPRPISNIGINTFANIHQNNTYDSVLEYYPVLWDQVVQTDISFFQPLASWVFVHKQKELLLVETAPVARDDVLNQSPGLVANRADTQFIERLLHLMTEEDQKMLSTIYTVAWRWWEEGVGKHDVPGSIKIPHYDFYSHAIAFLSHNLIQYDNANEIHYLGEGNVTVQDINLAWTTLGTFFFTRILDFFGKDAMDLGYTQEQLHVVDPWNEPTMIGFNNNFQLYYPILIGPAYMMPFLSGMPLLSLTYGEPESRMLIGNVPHQTVEFKKEGEQPYFIPWSWMDNPNQLPFVNDNTHAYAYNGALGVLHVLAPVTPSFQFPAQNYGVPAYRYLGRAYNYLRKSNKPIIVNVMPARPGNHNGRILTPASEQPGMIPNELSAGWSFLGQ